MEIPPMDQITKEQAIELYNSGAWKKWGDEKIVRFQLFQKMTCMPMDVFLGALAKVLGRTVYLHELSDRTKLIEEYLGTRPAPTFAEIADMLPKDKTIPFQRPDGSNSPNESVLISNVADWKNGTKLIKENVDGHDAFITALKDADIHGRLIFGDGEIYLEYYRDGKVDGSVLDMINKAATVAGLDPDNVNVFFSRNKTVTITEGVRLIKKIIVV